MIAENTRLHAQRIADALDVEIASAAQTLINQENNWKTEIRTPQDLEKYTAAIVGSNPGFVTFGVLTEKGFERQIGESDFTPSYIQDLEFIKNQNPPVRTTGITSSYGIAMDIWFEFNLPSESENKTTIRALYRLKDYMNIVQQIVSSYPETIIGFEPFVADQEFYRQVKQRDLVVKGWQWKNHRISEFNLNEVQDIQASYPDRYVISYTIKANLEVIGTLKAYYTNGAEDLTRLMLDSLISILEKTLARHDAIRKGVLLSTEIDVADTIRKSVLSSARQRSDSRIAQYFKPAERLGGDWFYTIPHEARDCCYFIMGRVSGQGLSQGLLTAGVKGGLDVLDNVIRFSEIDPFKSPAEVIPVIQRVVNSMNKSSENLVTCFVMHVDFATCTVSVANNGHALPIMVRQNPNKAASVFSIDHEKKSVTQNGIQICQTVMQKGDYIVAFSDGLSNAKGFKSDIFERFMVRSLENGQAYESATELVDDLKNIYNYYTSNKPQNDDVCFMAINSDELGDGNSDVEGSSDVDGNANSGGKSAEWSCPKTAKPKGNRILGLDFINGSETGTYDESQKIALAMGVREQGIHIAWSEIEKAPGQFSDPGDTLATLASVSDKDGVKMSIQIKPIDMTGKTVPTDLANKRFNSAEMKTRYKALLDYVLSLVPKEKIASFQIGNEIDGYDTSSEDPDFWSDYGEFLTEMTTYLHSKDASLAVGFVATFSGLTKGPLKEYGIWKALSDAVDFVGVTYYPMNDQFVPNAPDVVKNDFELITKEFGEKTIYITEVGYHTPSKQKDAELNQAKFFCNVFQEWDKHPTIRLMDITRLQDVSRQDAIDLAGPYGISSDSFIEYLQMLGLRTHLGKGTDKIALTVIKEQAKARGF